jgi:hypothetical protein
MGKGLLQKGYTLILTFSGTLKGTRYPMHCGGFRYRRREGKRGKVASGDKEAHKDETTV